MPTPLRAKIPLICIGNLVAGGAGKTPAALAVASLVRQLGRQPHFLTRGLRRRAWADPSWSILSGTVLPMSVTKRCFWPVYRTDMGIARPTERC